MKKFFLLGILMPLILISCSESFSSKEIDGVEFTGKGVFGDIPYICVDYLKEFNTDRENAISSCQSRYETIKEKENLSIPFEVHINGKNMLDGELELKLKDYDPVTKCCYAYYSVIYPDNFVEKTGKNDLFTLLLDKDDQVVYTYNVRIPEFCIGSSDPYIKDWKWKNLFEENQAYDKTVKVLLVDEEEYLKRMNQKGYEISKKEGTGKGALVAFDLKGNVKACQEKNEMGYTRTLEFDENGKLTSCDGNAVQNIYSKIKEDEMGRMSITERTEDYVVIETTYEYDAKTGYLLKQKEMEPEGKMVRTYSYDENGFVTKMQEVGEYTEMDAEQSMKINRTSLYTYLSIDAHGNWTKRQVESEGAMITEVRTIQYY